MDFEEPIVFEQLVKKRFSARSFKNDYIPDELIRVIVECGIAAPTAKNNQPEIVYVVRSDEGLAKIDKLTPCRYNAPVCMIICSDRDVAYKNGDFSTYQIDASIVATHMMLEATNLGINSCWIQSFDPKEVKSLFEMEDNLEPVCILNFGYKTDACNPSPMHNTRKSYFDVARMV